MHRDSNVSGDPRSPSAASWRIAIASMIALLAGASTLTVFGLGMFIKPLQAEFGWTLTQVSAANSVVAFGCIVSSMVQGFLIDRFGARRIILISAPLLGLAFASLSMLQGNLMLFYLAWLLIPLLGVGTWAGSYAKIIANWFDYKLGLALGIASVGVGLGSALIPALTHMLLEHYGWRGAYVGIGAVSVAIAWPVAFWFLRDRPSDAPNTGQHTAQRASASSWGHSLAQAARLRPYWALIAAFTLLGFVTTGIATHLVPMLINGGVGPRAATLGQTTMGIGLILGRLIAGYCLDRLPTIGVAATTMSGLILGFTGFAVLGVAPESMYLFAFLIGVGIGAEFDLLGFYVRRYFGTRAYGRLYCSIFAAFQLGAAVGSVAVAAAATQFGSYAPVLLLMAGMVFCAILLFGALGPLPDRALPTTEMPTTPLAGAG